jgi:hypothetical protein
MRFKKSVLEIIIFDGFLHINTNTPKQWGNIYLCCKTCFTKNVTHLYQKTLLIKTRISPFKIFPDEKCFF